MGAMKETTVPITLAWNDYGSPVPSIPDGAYVKLKVADIRNVNDSAETTWGTDVILSGNREGLLSLAAFIVGIAECKVKGFHQHLDVEAFNEFFGADKNLRLTLFREIDRKKDKKE